MTMDLETYLIMKENYIQFYSNTFLILNEMDDLRKYKWTKLVQENM